MAVDEQVFGVSGKGGEPSADGGGIVSVSSGSSVSQYFYIAEMLMCKTHLLSTVANTFSPLWKTPSLYTEANTWPSTLQLAVQTAAQSK